MKTIPSTSATAATAEIYADTSSIGTAETGITYTIPVNVSACGQGLTGFKIDLQQVTNASGEYASIVVHTEEKSGRIIVVKF